MNADELAAIIDSIRQSKTDLASVEVKRASTPKLSRTIAHSLSAFSNTHGGVIILGLEETAKFSAGGVSDSAKLMADLASLCAEMEPPLRPHIEHHVFEDVDLIVCEVDEISATQKPCYIRSKGMNNGSYARVHDADQRLTTYEIQLLLAGRNQPRDDDEIVPTATVDDLDTERAEQYIARVRAARPRSFERLSYADALKVARILKREGEQDVPTLAGLLALGRNPQQFFPQLNVTFVHYPTVDGTADAGGQRFIDNVSIDGPIPVMVSETLKVLRRNMSRRAVITGVGRSDISEYPETALREAVVNACIHRDLSGGARGTQVQIEMYPDRLVVKNPGGLFGPVTVEGLGEENMSSARNASLMRVLEDVLAPDEERGICENRGSGIRAMIAALRQANMRPPDFSDKVSSFTVTFPNHSLFSDAVVEWIESLGQAGLSENQCLALVEMNAGRAITNLSYRAMAGVDSQVAYKDLQDLVSRELIILEGKGRWTKYRLNEDRLVPEEARALPTDDSVPSSGRRHRADRRDEFLAILGTATMSRDELESTSGHPGSVVRHWMKTLRDEGMVETVGGSGPQSPKTKYRRTKRAAEVDSGQEMIRF